MIDYYLNCVKLTVKTNFAKEVNMDTVLTINVDQTVVQNAEIYASYSKKTVSQLVEEYLSSIPMKNKIDNKQLGPITRQLAGIIKINKNINHKEVLTDALMEKYF